MNLSNLLKKTSNSPKILLFTLLGAIALISAGAYIFLPQKSPNYKQLEAYLKNKELSKAEPETQRLLLEIADEQTTLDRESIAKFPCKHLEKINKLWVENSDGKFGFTPKK